MESRLALNPFLTLPPQQKGLILGVYEVENELVLTKGAQRYNEQVGGKLLELIKK